MIVCALTPTASLTMRSKRSAAPRIKPTQKQRLIHCWSGTRRGRNRDGCGSRKSDSQRRLREPTLTLRLQPVGSDQSVLLSSKRAKLHSINQRFPLRRCSCTFTHAFSRLEQRRRVAEVEQAERQDLEERYANRTKAALAMEAERQRRLREANVLKLRGERDHMWHLRSYVNQMLWLEWWDHAQWDPDNDDGVEVPQPPWQLPLFYDTAADPEVLAALAGQLV
mmetsp:Transcript_14867/g.32309  ORF Transcript_14867/g.32309 Transcript_14867/m.32309 type:complete len:223 (+) Transcript_14867:228-896(+)